MKLYDAVSITVSRAVRDALRKTNGNYRQAAELLGVNRTHLYRMTKGFPRSRTRLPPHKVIPELANWRRA